MCYYYIKSRLYNHTFYIPIEQTRGDVVEIKQWLKENINGRSCIEERTLPIDDWHRPDVVLGWTIRFIHETDAMAFKIVWTQKDE